MYQLPSVKKVGSYLLRFAKEVASWCFNHLKMVELAGLMCMKDVRLCCFVHLIVFHSIFGFERQSGFYN